MVRIMLYRSNTKGKRTGHDALLKESRMGTLRMSSIGSITRRKMMAAGHNGGDMSTVPGLTQSWADSDQVARTVLLNKTCRTVPAKTF